MKDDRVHPAVALLLIVVASGLLWALFLWFAPLLAGTR